MSKRRRNADGQLAYGRWYIGDWISSATVLALSSDAYRLFHLFCLRVMERGALPDDKRLIRSICPGVEDFDAAWAEVRPLLASASDDASQSPRLIFQRRALAEHEHGVSLCAQAQKAVNARERRRGASDDASNDTSADTSDDASDGVSNQYPVPTTLLLQQQQQPPGGGLGGAQPPHVAGQQIQGSEGSSTDHPTAPSPGSVPAGQGAQPPRKRRAPKPPPPGVQELAAAHEAAVLGWKPDARPGCLSQTSRRAYGLLLGADARPLAAALELVRWLFGGQPGDYAPRGDFDWRPNVLSGTALRKHWDRLESERQRAPATNGSGARPTDRLRQTVSNLMAKHGIRPEDML